MNRFSVILLSALLHIGQRINIFAYRMSSATINWNGIHWFHWDICKFPFQSVFGHPFKRDNIDDEPMTLMEIQKQSKFTNIICIKFTIFQNLIDTYNLLVSLFIFFFCSIAGCWRRISILVVQCLSGICPLLQYWYSLPSVRMAACQQSLRELRANTV